MRSIPGPTIAAFVALLASVVALAVQTARSIEPWCAGLGEYRGIVVASVAMVCVYLYAIGLHRLLLWRRPLCEGPVLPGSAQEFHYQLYLLSYLIILNSLIRSRVLPIPFMRLVYVALGARLGADTYSAGTIFDPSLVVIGACTLVGEATLLVPHVIEGTTLAHYRIAIGSHVTIGAGAIVMAGATIGDHAIVAANAVVIKHSRIPAGETWGGAPARCLRVARSSSVS